MGTIGSMLGDLAAKMAKRLEILAAIKKLQELVDIANEAKTSINLVNTQISNSVSVWSNALSSFQSSAMAPVVVADRFEGESAEKISVGLPTPIAQMEGTRSSAEGVQGEIAVQITLLEKYIEEKQTEIDELWAQYWAV